MSWAGDGSRLTRMTRHGMASWNPRRLLWGGSGGGLCCCVLNASQVFGAAFVVCVYACGISKGGIAAEWAPSALSNH